MALSPRALGLSVVAGAFAVDQATKYWFLHVYELGGRDPLPLTPFLDLVLAWNAGVSYSLFRADGPGGRLALIGVAALGVLALAIWLWRAQERLTAVALGLIIGGALGNALDRLNYGAVADFLHFHTPFPAGPLANYVFNGADVAIVAGVALLLYETLFARPKAPGDRLQNAQNGD